MPGSLGCSAVSSNVLTTGFQPYDIANLVIRGSKIGVIGTARRKTRLPAKVQVGVVLSANGETRAAKLA